MKRSITPKQIKENNRQLIYRYIYEHPKVSLQDIAFHLRLSRPTVTAKITELEKAGLIVKDGLIESNLAGRKPAAYSIDAEYRLAFGIEITPTEFKVIAVDLYGIQLKRIAYPLPYSNTDEYYESACNCIKDYIQQLQIRDEQILGMGIALPALVSEDRQNITYGKVLECTGLNIDVFTSRLPYPCNFIHDAAAAAASELWASSDLQDAFYLSIGKHLGAAMIVDRNVSIGKHGHSATVEHVSLFHNQKKCYCGKEGCIETECSLSSLLKPGETIEDFFEHLEDAEAAIDERSKADRAETEAPDALTMEAAENAEYRERWKNFLLNLAIAINALHLIYDTDFILGGYIAPFLRPKDVALLQEEAANLTPFDEARDFISISRMPKHNITIGAALSYLEEFLEENA